MTNKEIFKCGYIAIVGKTNAGKSTLINTLTGEKVAIVSPKTQTTRNNILGILTSNNYQLVFIDTPGIHKSRNNLDKEMNKNIRTALSSVDVILYVLDAAKKVDETELDYINHINQSPVILVLSKSDLINQGKIIEIIDMFKNVDNIKAIVPISSLKNKNIEILITEILKLLPGQETKNFYFNDDEYTDKSIKFLVSEIIREKALFCLQEEIPHGVAVNIISYTESSNLTTIKADIICEKDSHKNIIIGKQGTKIKEISTKARLEIEQMINKKVMLETYVRVKKNWRNFKNTETIFD